MPVSVPENYVYLDWAATAPLGQEAFDAMADYLKPGMANLALGGANANSLHSPGRLAFERMELARRSIAGNLGAARPSEIVFTSGATEADNAAILGIAHGATAARRQAHGASFSPRVIVSAIEHDAVLAPARRLRSEGYDVVFLKADRQGFVSLESLSDALADNTVLVSVQLANSEVGAIQPIAEIASVAHGAGALVHTDAVQALGKIPVDVQQLGVDAASFSAHKIGGPKGVGALYLKARTPFETCMLGGGQESGERSGTQNVAGIVGFAAACSWAASAAESEWSRLADLRDELYGRLSSMDGVDATVPAAGSNDYLPNIVHVLVDGFESETLVLRLDRAGFGVSGGSACSSHSLEPSHVLKAMGIPSDQAYGALRISMGRYTMREDVNAFADAFAELVGTR